jgi:putative peptide zinc metalloprotease protein
VSTRQSKIELLVRAPDGSDFETREIPSALTYLQYRPQRVPADQWELAQLPSGIHRTASFVLKNRRTERYLLLTEPEKFLWEQMDGNTSVQELGTAYVLRYGAFNFDIIPRLITNLHRAEFLTMRPTSRLREVLARHRRNPAVRAAEATLKALERLTVTSRTAHRVFERAYRYGAFVIFTPVAAVALAAVIVLGARGAVLLWPESGQITSALARNPLVAILWVKLFFWLTVMSHQILHGLALVHYRRRVREFGFTMLHGFIPTFFADVTDIFMASRRARIVTALVGPLVHLFLAALYLWIASFLETGLVQAFLAASAILQLQSFFVSLYPFCFLEMDGYHILVDVLAMPNLNRESMAFIRRGLWRRLRERHALSRQEWVYVGYFALSTVSVIGFIGLNVWVLTRASQS